MGWTAHRIVLRLRSPMHIGAGKLGNLQRTRPYVVGRNLWGALTARLTRDDDLEGKPDPRKYQEVGEDVHSELAFTYFFPTTDPKGGQPLFPNLDARGHWSYGGDGSGAYTMDASAFRYRFLSTYASTALDYMAYSAQEASLHEVECLTPHTRDGTPVYLTGYIFQRAGSGLKWQDALHRLQIGGERGYGWGRVEVSTLTDIQESKVPLFGTDHVVRLDESRVRIRMDLGRGQPILAHTLAADFEEDIAGLVEPLVGRETKPDTRFGVYLSSARICYTPGARVEKAVQVQIGRFGIWEAL